MKRTRFWVLLIACLLLISLGISVYIYTAGQQGVTARIILKGEVYREIDLSRVREAYDIRIETELGVNTIHVAPGEISVSSADCPDQICVLQGTAAPIACLPHELIIELVDDSLDG